MASIRRNHILAWACLLTGTCTGLLQASQTEADEFEAIFGRPPPTSAETLTIPLILDGRAAGDVRVTIASGAEDLEIIAEPLLDLLKESIAPDSLDPLRTASDATGRLRLSHLRAAGVEAEFDWQRLELHVGIPPELRPTSTIHLSRRQPPRGTGHTVEPSAVSAFLNVRTGIDHVQQSSTGYGEGLQPIRADFDGAINLHNWVIEGSARYTEDATYPWRRGNFRLVRDDPERRLRYTAGDLAYPTTGFQQFRPMAGVTVARNFALQPYRITEPRGQTSFFLRSPSTVEVLVNGRPIRTLRLAPGPHSLQDFNLADGGNDVVLQITDDVGRRETLRLSFFFDARLLAAGEHEFAYSVGVPSHPGDRGPEYATDTPAVSFFHRFGITDSFSAGMNFQGDENRQLMGVESLWATGFGTFQPDIAGSHMHGGSNGYAARLGYRYHDLSSHRGRSWNVSAQYQSPGFAGFNASADTSAWNPVAWSVSARYRQRLPLQFHGGVGITHQIRRTSPSSLTGLNLFLSRRIGRSGSMDVSLDRRETRDGTVDHRAFISYTYVFPGHRQRIRTTYDSLSGTSRADWYYTARNPVGGMDANLGVQHSHNNESIYGGTRYTGYRGEASLVHDVTTPISGEMQTDSRTRFRFGTALVYADGQFAVSRPVRDSFAMITAHPDLHGHTIGVDPLRERHSAKIDRWGPAVIPDLNAYLARNIVIDAPDLPPGYEIGSSVYTLLPAYKTGTVVRVGTGATVLYSGILQDADGMPVPLKFGEIIALADSDQPPIEFFTNRSGRFSIEGLRPGSYEMILFNDVPTSAHFTIPPDRSGIYDAGILRLASD